MSEQFKIQISKSTLHHTQIHDRSFPGSLTWRCLTSLIDPNHTYIYNQDQQLTWACIAHVIKNVYIIPYRSILVCQNLISQEMNIIVQISTTSHDLRFICDNNCIPEPPLTCVIIVCQFVLNVELLNRHTQTLIFPSLQFVPLMLNIKLQITIATACVYLQYN